MNKFKFLLSIVLTIVALVFILWKLVRFNQLKTPIMISDHQPNWQTGYAIICVYNTMGRLSYKLVTDETQHFSKKKISWFINPILTTYNTKSTTTSPTWTISANKAKLVNNMLYLYNNVQVNSLTPNSDLQRILTKNAIVNLTTQDILSNDKITIIGVGLRSVGMKMRGNLQANTMELIKNTKTYYNIPNKQPYSKGEAIKCY